MAMTPRSVKIDNTDIDDVNWVSFAVDTPITYRNYFEARTRAGVIHIRREALRNPSTKLFQLATNEDGRKKVVDGEIVLRDPETAETYTITFKKAFVQQWKVESHTDDGNYATPAVETVTINAGEIDYKAGSDTANFKVPSF